MADDSASWPLPKFSFIVDFGDGRPHGFTEVSGLGTEPAVEYRHGDGRYTAMKLPGLGKLGNVTLKRGVLTRDSVLWDWLGAAERGRIRRRTVTISLRDERASPTMRWTLTNAWPVKISADTIESEAEEIPVETLELAYEALSTEV